MATSSWRIEMTNTPLSFVAFVASRRDADAAALAEIASVGIGEVSELGGYVYDGDCWIEKQVDGRYALYITSQQWIDSDLGKLERILYEFWYVPECPTDRKRVVWGKSVSDRLERGGGRSIKK